MKLRGFLGIFAVTWAVLACTRLSIPLGVTIRAPGDGEALGLGQSFRVVADSDLDQPPNQSTLFEIQLFDLATGYAVTWKAEVASNDGSRVMDASFSVPADAPTGDGYRLRVSVLPYSGGSDQPRYSFADTIRVRVIASP